MIHRGFITTVRTLTIIPIPGCDAELKYLTLPWFALVGILIGGLHLALYAVITVVPGELAVFSGLLLTVLNYLVTGALHLDGLADTADAFGSYNDCEKTLEILKDHHLGTFGVASAAIVITWRITVYQLLSVHASLIWILFALGFSRIVQGIILCLFPYARDAAGKAHGYAGPPWVLAILIIQFVSLASLVWVLKEPKLLLVSMAAGIVAVLPVCFLYMKRIGGITGDGIGAASELFELAFLTGSVAWR